MKIAWVTTFYRTEELKDVRRLEREIAGLGFSDWHFYVSDRRRDNRGYAAGINECLQQAINDNYDLFIISNPDISLSGLTADDLIAGKKHFDIWGGAMEQDGIIYFGGEIDKWRLSGGLIKKEPLDRFFECDFVSGSLMIVDRKAIDRLGLLNEKYFIYYEEVEYCFRAKRLGLKVGIDTAWKYKHLEVSNQANPQKNYLLARNRLIFFLKYSNFRQKIREMVRTPKTIFEEVIKRPFLVNFFSLNLSSFSTKLLNFINFIFLVRFLTVPEYGIYTLVWAQVGLLSPLVDFGTTSYGIVHLPTEKEGRFRTLVNLRLILSLIIFAVTIILAGALFHGSQKIFIYILVTSVAIFTNMMSGSYFIWNAIKEKIFISSRNSFIFNLLLISTIIAVLFLTRRLLAVFIVIFIYYVGYAAANYLFLRHELRRFVFKFDPAGWFQIIKQSYIFVLIAFFGELYFNLDVFLLKGLKGEAAVGIYSAGYKFFDALLFIAASYNVTATPVFARLSKNGLLFMNRIKKDLLFLAFVGLGTALGVYFLAPPILPFVLKSNFRPSIPVLKVVIFTLPLVLLNSVLLNILYVLKKAYLVIFVFIFQTIFNFTLNWLLIPRFSFMASSAITVLSELTNLIILIFLTHFVWIKYYENRY